MKASISVSVKFQSTYLYKVRRIEIAEHGRNQRFNPRTYIRYDSILLTLAYMVTSFNPRTYIRYDKGFHNPTLTTFTFQSTYLYKVRPSTSSNRAKETSFNPRTYIRYDPSTGLRIFLLLCFNPRTYIRYDLRRD